MGGFRLFRPIGLCAAFLFALSGFAGPALATGPTMVVEVSSGRVLHAVGAHDPWYPASLTKLMTIYVAFRHVRDGKISFDASVPISAAAAAEPPSKMGLDTGSIVPLDDALRMLAVKSANDIAVAVAERLSGSAAAFAEEMNGYSRELGMNGTNWVNPHGLPDQRQVTTARDMAILGRALLLEFPRESKMFETRAIQLDDVVHRNHNNLIGRLEGADGMKTGYICSAGFNLVASATRSGRRMVGVVMGAHNARERAELAASILDASFDSAWFSLTPIHVDTIERPDGTAAAPVDLRPIVCGGEDRRQPGDDILTDASIDIERGRRLLAAAGGGNTALMGGFAPVTVTAFSSPELKSAIAEMPIPRPRPSETAAEASASAAGDASSAN